MFISLLDTMIKHTEEKIEIIDLCVKFENVFMDFIYPTLVNYASLVKLRLVVTILNKVFFCCCSETFTCNSLRKLCSICMYNRGK